LIFFSTHPSIPSGTTPEKHNRRENMNISVTINDINGEDLARITTALAPLFAKSAPPAPTPVSKPEPRVKAPVVAQVEPEAPKPAAPLPPRPPVESSPPQVESLRPPTSEREYTVAEKRAFEIHGVKIGDMKISQLRAAADEKGGFSIAGMSRYQAEKAVFSLWFFDGSEAREIRASIDEANDGAPPVVRGRGRPPKSATTEPAPEPKPKPKKAKEPEPEPEDDGVEDAEIVDEDDALIDEPEDDGVEDAEIVDEDDEAEEVEETEEETEEVEDDDAEDEVFEDDEAEDEVFEDEDEGFVVTSVPETLREARRFADVVRAIAAIHETTDPDKIYRWIEAYAPHVPKLQNTLPSVNVARIKGVLIS
jgi:hypothetical protein